jgi:phosphohistidine swiveling domain-containing protein
MASFVRIETIVRTHGLKPATQRNLSLFTLSCIAHGYTAFLRPRIGFSYDALAGVGTRGHFHTLLNEERIAQQTEQVLKKDLKGFMEKTLLRAHQDGQKCIAKAKALSKLKNPLEKVRTILDIYPRYISALGVYNCLWRYVGNETCKGKLTEKMIQKIGKERDQIAPGYPLMDALTQKWSIELGKKWKMNGGLLVYATLPELKTILERETITANEKRVLQKRMQGYFYLFVEKGGTEEVFTSKTLLKQIHQKWFEVKAVNHVQGKTAFPGKVKGVVFNLQTHSRPPNGKFVLVASMTHPKDIALIRKAQAIVTDEGGVLSHASIISRELKKTCIIGTKTATRLLAQGDKIEVDANKGTVRIIQ